MTTTARTSCIAVAALVLVLGGARGAAAQVPAPGPGPGIMEQGEWIASGFAGPVWGADTDGAQAEFGGALTWLFDQSVGGEVAINVAPGFGFSEPTADGHLSTYFLNGVWALPMEPEDRLRPFASVGIGLMRVGGDVEFFTGDVEEFSETRLATNIGVGLLFFSNGPWGVRSDLRYVWGFENDDDDEDLEFEDPTDVLGNTNFLRWNIGVSYRW